MRTIRGFVLEMIQWVVGVLLLVKDLTQSVKNPGEAEANTADAIGLFIR